MWGLCTVSSRVSVSNIFRFIFKKLFYIIIIDYNKIYIKKDKRVKKWVVVRGVQTKKRIDDSLENNNYLILKIKNCQGLSWGALSLRVLVGHMPRDVQMALIYNLHHGIFAMNVRFYDSSITWVPLLSFLC